MIYTHPHKRGLSIGLDREGYWRIWILFYKWEIHCSIHRSIDLDYVRRFWEQKIALEESRSKLLSDQLAIAESRILARYWSEY